MVSELRKWWSLESEEYTDTGSPLYNSCAATASLFDFGLDLAEDKTVVWKCAPLPPHCHYRLPKHLEFYLEKKLKIVWSTWNLEKINLGKSGLETPIKNWMVKVVNRKIPYKDLIHGWDM